MYILRDHNKLVSLCWVSYLLETRSWSSICYYITTVERHKTRP